MVTIATLLAVEGFVLTKKRITRKFWCQANETWYSPMVQYLQQPFIVPPVTDGSHISQKAVEMAYDLLSSKIPFTSNLEKNR